MEPKSERFEMRLDAGVLERIDSWRKKEDDLPSRSEAVRRLVEMGLGTQTRISDGEKLTLLMLSEISKKLGLEDGIDPEFVESVIYGGHYWALKWKYGGIFHGHSDNEQILTEVVDILDMWSFLESGFKRLSAKDREWLASEVPVLGERVSYPGFDGNNESEHLGIASFLIEKLDRFTTFKERAHLNSHFPTLSGYRRMLGAFLPIRQNIMGGELSASQIAKVLNARRHDAAASN